AKNNPIPTQTAETYVEHLRIVPSPSIWAALLGFLSVQRRHDRPNIVPDLRSRSGFNPKIGINCCTAAAGSKRSDVLPEVALILCISSFHRLTSRSNAAVRRAGNVQRRFPVPKIAAHWAGTHSPT